MERKKILVGAVLLLTGTVIVTWAANPHFVGKTTATLDGTSVVVSWKEAGLGNNQLIDYVASADATATFDCVNNGGNCPNAANKHTVSGPVSAEGTFSSGQNGQITQSLTIGAPGPGGFSCPGGQTLTLSEVSYSNIQIEDFTNGVVEGATPSALSATYFTCP